MGGAGQSGSTAETFNDPHGIFVTLELDLDVADNTYRFRLSVVFCVCIGNGVLSGPRGINLFFAYFKKKPRQRMSYTSHVYCEWKRREERN
jgi:hypothetical protein